MERAKERLLGNRIRHARTCYGMSQAELARRIGISTTSMNQIESGETPDPRASRVRAIADVLRVSADYLLGRENAQGEPEPALVGVTKQEQKSEQLTAVAS